MRFTKLVILLTTLLTIVSITCLTGTGSTFVAGTDCDSPADSELPLSSSFELPEPSLAVSDPVPELAELPVDASPPVVFSVELDVPGSSFD